MEMGFLKFAIKTIFIDTLLFILNLLDYIPELFLSQKEKERREKRKQVFVCTFTVKKIKVLKEKILIKFE